MAFPVELPAATRDQLLIQPSTLANWMEQYGIDFSPLAALANNSPINFSEMPAKVAKWAALAGSQVVSDFDLSRPSHPAGEAGCEFKVDRAGQIDGFVVWFCAELAEGNQLATDPRELRLDNHWRHPVHLLAQAIPVCPGDAVRLWLVGDGQRSARAEVSV